LEKSVTRLFGVSLISKQLGNLQMLLLIIVLVIAAYSIQIWMPFGVVKQVITNDSSLAFPNLANKTLCILMQYSSCL
jgi:hypothetical protein